MNIHPNEGTDTAIAWTVLTHADWTLHFAAAPGGLAYVGSPNRPFAELAAWADARFPDMTLIRDDARMAPYTRELREYLRGERSFFSVPCELRGTPFQLEVWNALRAIPYGQTRSYTEIAAQIGRPAAVRAVGAAIGANPVLMSVPCHRVIGKNGTLTGFRGGLAMKTRLLELERSGVLLREASLYV